MLVGDNLDIKAIAFGREQNCPHGTLISFKENDLSKMGMNGALGSGGVDCARAYA